MELNVSSLKEMPVVPPDRLRGADGAEKWLVRFRPNPAARMRLFCFPYAGGGASAYFRWAHGIDAAIELVAVQMPGHENRLRERPMTRVAEAVNQLVGVIESLQDRPYAFFGHSLGAFIAFETARTMRDRGYPGPSHLFVSAQRAPHCGYRYSHVHHLPAQLMLSELLKRWGGIPSGILNEPDLINTLLPTIRADVGMVETYTYVQGAPLACSISVFGGRDDETVTPGELRAWQQHSSGPVDLMMMPGGHFFLRAQHEQIVKALSAALLPMLESVP